MQYSKELLFQYPTLHLIIDLSILHIDKYSNSYSLQYQCQVDYVKVNFNDFELDKIMFMHIT